MVLAGNKSVSPPNLAFSRWSRERQSCAAPGTPGAVWLAARSPRLEVAVNNQATVGKVVERSAAVVVTGAPP